LDIKITATDQGGLMAEGDFNLSIDPVGLDELTLAFELYPNPAEDQLNISGDLPVGGHLEVIDMTGRLMDSRQIMKSPMQIDTDRLAPGQYFVRIIDVSRSYTAKFIKR
jgi:hypothetical protein